MLSEEWREIPSLHGVEASSLGRICIRPYRVPGPGRGCNRLVVGKPHFGTLRKGRYWVNIRGRRFAVSRLVCEAFHGPAPSERPNCLHGDEDATNNRPDNLAWGTQKENLNAPGFLAYCRGRVGDASPVVKAKRAGA